MSSRFAGASDTFLCYGCSLNVISGNFYVNKSVKIFQLLKYNALFMLVSCTKKRKKYAEHPVLIICFAEEHIRCSQLTYTKFLSVVKINNPAKHMRNLCLKSDVEHLNKVMIFNFSFLFYILASSFAPHSRLSSSYCPPFPTLLLQECVGA